MARKRVKSVVRFPMDYAALFPVRPKMVRQRGDRVYVADDGAEVHVYSWIRPMTTDEYEQHCHEEYKRAKWRFDRWQNGT